MLGHLIYSYNHLQDARIQQDISRQLYDKEFGGVYVVHAHNGGKDIGYQKYKEDKLIRIKNRGHFLGACDLINAGLKHFSKNKITGLKYVLVTAADTWCLNAEFIKKIVSQMQAEGQAVASSSWGRANQDSKIRGLATDFFIIDIEWNRKAKIWPIDYKKFVKKFKDQFALHYAIPTVEAAFAYEYQKYFIDNYADNEMWRKRDAMLRRITEREPIHNEHGRIANWPELGLYTDPYSSAKQKFLDERGLDFGKSDLQ